MYFNRYNVILDYVKISLFTNNVDWINKTITINHNTEHIIVNITHLQSKDKTKTNNKTNNCVILPDLLINNPAPTQQDINNYWYNLPDSIKNNIDIIRDLQINIDYFIAPFYITNNIVILGIIKYEPKIINEILPDIELPSKSYKNYKIINSFIYLSTIKPYNTNKTQYNIVNGILNYRDVKYDITTFTKKIYEYNNIICSNFNIDSEFNNISLQENIQLQDSITQHSNILSVKWDHIFRNIANYLPSLQIIYKPKQYTILKCL